MEYLTGIYLTDEKLKNGMQYQVKDLEHLVWLSKSGTPSSIAHDVHRTVGWTRVNGMYISHEKCYVLGKTGFPETDEELQRIRFATEITYQKRTNDALQQYGKEMENLFSGKGLGERQKQVLYGNMLTMGYDGIVGDLYPKLVDKTDDDGLISVQDILQDFNYLSQGVFCEKFGKLTVMLHPFMRLSQSIFNDFDYRFIKLLMAVYKNGNKSVKVKIDMDRVGYAPSFRYSHNDDYWFVPDYDDDTKFMVNGLQTYPMPGSYAVFNQLDRTEYKWASRKDGNMQIEMEEVIAEKAPTFPKETYACRYIHAMIDPNQGFFNHFDGAIRAYDTEKFYNRIGVPMDQAGHDTTYTKLFRVDGNIPVNLWKKLVTQYLHGNPSVYDFMGVQQPKSVMKADDRPANPLQMYVPYIINKGDGVRIYVSYHEYRGCNVERKFDTTEVVDTKEGKLVCQEFQTIEVAKAIWKEGGKLDLTGGMKYIIVEDYTHNIPVIMHGDDNLEQNMRVTLNGIKRLMKCHVEKGDDDVYSICLSWNMDGANVCLSFMGHVEDIYRWLKKNNVIPTDHHNFIMWIDRQAKLLKRYGRDSLAPNGNELIKNDGVLYFQRRPVLRDATIVELEKEKDGLYGKLIIDDEKKELAALVERGNIHTTPELLVTGARCNDSGEDYLNTVRSGIFGETTYTPECEMLGFMWTTNPRPICMV